MEIPVTAHPKGFMIKVTAGTPEKVDLTIFLGRYVKVYSPDADFYWNVGLTASTAAAILGDETTESTGGELTGDGTVTPYLAPKTLGDGFVVQRETPACAVEPLSGTDVRIFFKPSSQADQPPVA